MRSTCVNLRQRSLDISCDDRRTAVHHVHQSWKFDEEAVVNRAVVRATVVLALLGALALPATAWAHGADKIDICHKTGDGEFVRLSIAAPAHDKHIVHGDGEVGQPVPGASGLVFGDDCAPEPQLVSFARVGCFETYGGGLFIYTDGQNPQLVEGPIPLFNDATCLRTSLVAKGVVALVWAIDANEAAAACASLGSAAPNQQREPHLVACL
jgi:hypothetical protein